MSGSLIAGPVSHHSSCSYKVDDLHPGVSAFVLKILLAIFSCRYRSSLPYHLPNILLRTFSETFSVARL